MKSVWLALSFIMLSGCANLSTDSVTVSESDQSLAEIRKAIVVVIGEPRTTSQNQREFTSAYFSKKQDPKFDPEKSKLRYYCVVTILGPRRPYDIEIRSFVESRSGNTYEEIGSDPAVAQKIAKEIKDRLNQSRDTRNVIDDFRAF